MFTNYRDEAAGLAAALVNTVGSITGTDYMSDLGSFRDFLVSNGLEADRVTEKDLEGAHAVRDGLRRVFLASSDEDVAVALNELLARAGARPEVTVHDGVWHLHYVDEKAPIADRLAIVAAMGLATVVAELGRERLGLCGADDCKDVFVDTSRNRSRRYCTDTCATRMNVAAYRARKQAGSST